ncbi:MAG: SCP2 domain-containing protein [Burkholderiales bacterium]
MIPSTPLFVIPSTINHLLAQEPWARAKLMPHSGKIARFDFAVLTLDLRVMADGMLAIAEDGVEPQVTIRIKQGELPLILQSRERAFAAVTVEGDADFADVISQIGRLLHWEAEEDLSKLIGDIAATRLVAGAREVLHTVKTAQQKLTENLAEYFLEERPMLVRPQAVIDFGSDIARIRDDVERMAKRIEKLEGRIK